MQVITCNLSQCALIHIGMLKLIEDKSQITNSLSLTYSVEGALDRKHRLFVFEKAERLRCNSVTEALSLLSLSILEEGNNMQFSFYLFYCVLQVCRDLHVERIGIEVQSLRVNPS